MILITDPTINSGILRMGGLRCVDDSFPRSGAVFCDESMV